MHEHERRGVRRSRDAVMDARVAHTHAAPSDVRRQGARRPHLADPTLEKGRGHTGHGHGNSWQSAV